MPVTSHKKGRRRKVVSKIRPLKSRLQSLRSAYNRFAANSRRLYRKERIFYDGSIGFLAGSTGVLSSLLLARQLRRPTIPKVALMAGGASYLIQKGLRRAIFGKKPPKAAPDVMLGGYVAGLGSMFPLFSLKSVWRPYTSPVRSYASPHARLHNYYVIIMKKVGPSRWEPE